MNRIILIGIIAVVVGAAVYVFLQGNFLANLFPTSSAQPSLATNDAETASTNAETSASGFVDDATPTADQVLPGLS